MMIKPWLFESGSLTERIKQTQKGQFSVALLQQGWDKPFTNDALVLGLGLSQRALIREVLLCVEQTPVVFARTTLPLAMVKRSQELTALGNKPLGDVIFSYPSLSRDQLDLCKLKSTQLKARVSDLCETQDTIFGRRNTYRLHHHRFVVSEFFLPSMVL